MSLVFINPSSPSIYLTQLASDTLILYSCFWQNIGIRSSAFWLTYLSRLVPFSQATLFQYCVGISSYLQQQWLHITNKTCFHFRIDHWEGLFIAQHCTSLSKKKKRYNSFYFCIRSEGIAKVIVDEQSLQPVYYNPLCVN